MFCLAVVHTQLWQGASWMAYRGKREKRAQERKGERETSSLAHGSFSEPTRESGVPFLAFTVTPSKFPIETTVIVQ